MIELADRSPVMRDTRQAGVARCDGIGDYIRRVEPSRAAQLEWARLSNGRSGDVTVPRPYCFNSIGAFSQINDFDDSDGDSYMIRPHEAGGAGAPYLVVLNVDPRGADRALADDGHAGALALGSPDGGRAPRGRVSRPGPRASSRRCTRRAPRERWRPRPPRSWAGTAS